LSLFSVSTKTLKTQGAFYKIVFVFYLTKASSCVSFSTPSIHEEILAAATVPWTDG
jgi:hypothetical protein